MTKPKRAGRKKIDIDFEDLDRHLMAGCTGADYARKLKCHKETVYDRVKQLTGLDFSDYRQQKIAAGDDLLRLAQFKSAVVDGDRIMQIWLGKQRLDQKDKKDVTSGNEALKAPVWVVGSEDEGKELKG